MYVFIYHAILFFMNIIFIFIQKYKFLPILNETENQTLIIYFLEPITSPSRGILRCVSPGTIRRRLHVCVLSPYRKTTGDTEPGHSAPSRFPYLVLSDAPAQYNLCFEYDFDCKNIVCVKINVFKCRSVRASHGFMC